MAWSNPNYLAENWVALGWLSDSQRGAWVSRLYLSRNWTSTSWLRFSAEEFAIANNARGLLSLSGGSAAFIVPAGFDSGELDVVGANLAFPAFVLADPGDLTFVAQGSYVDTALIADSAEVALEGGDAILAASIAIGVGSLALSGGVVSFSSTAVIGLAANSGVLLLLGADALLPASAPFASGELDLIGGEALAVVSLPATRGQAILVGGDGVFNTSVTKNFDPGSLVLSGQAVLRNILLGGKGTVNLVGSSATLVSTALDHVTAISGILQLLGSDAGLLITGLTWEGDDATWGGSQSMFGTAQPIFVVGNRFYQADASDLFDLEPIEVILERVGLTVVGVDREGKPRTNPWAVKLLTEIWPVVRGVRGTLIEIYAGSQDEPEDGILWQGPFNFIVGESKSVQPWIEGVFLATRFRSYGQKPWVLVGYDLDIQLLGDLPR